MIRFTRNFHSVGQGAFYSENINIHDKRAFRMVYDCGSTSLSQSDLTKRIKSDFSGNMNVDILFISHFDKDHINGIHNLKPKTVVIPFLSKDQISILKLYNNIFGETYNVELVENPTDVFPGEFRIIRVLPENNDLYDEEDLQELMIDINGDHREQDRHLRSNSSISISDGESRIWEYIPYSPNWDKFANKFKSAVQEAGLDWDKLTDTLNADYFNDNFASIKDVYNKLKSKNLHSLVVYSNAIADERISCCWYRNYLPIDFRYLYFDGYWIHSGCIYFGDATIESGWINSFYRYLKHTNRLHRVGILQVPHHGSYLSKGQNIISSKYPFDDFVVCIISVGEFNHFGHLSLHVVQELQRKRGIVFMVTEAPSSLFYIEGYID